MVIGMTPICMFCARYQERLTCDAYQDKIPDAIIFSEVDHRRPYEGDGGARFELDPDADPDEAADLFAALGFDPLDVDTEEER